MQRHHFKILFSTILTFAFSYFLIYLILKSSDGITNTEDLALGEFTSSVYGSSDNAFIHCKGYIDSKKCINSAIKSNLPIILWIGNSQLHGINQYEDGQKPAPEILHNILAEKNKFLLTFSLPNASLLEKFYLYKYLAYYLDIKTLVIPIIMDDLREGDIRFDIKNISKDINFVKTLDESFAIKLNSITGNDEKNDFDGLKDTYQERTEIILNKKLSSHSEAWAKRPELRAQIFNTLYRLRNTIFNINPSSERKMIPALYNLNLTSLKDILNETKIRNTKSILYIAPIRNDVKIPYNINEYNKFKEDIKIIAKKHNTTLLNLENLVPNKYWGLKGSTSTSDTSEIDFMHFQSEGHLILSKELSLSILAID